MQAKGSCSSPAHHRGNSKLFGFCSGASIDVEDMTATHLRQQQCLPRRTPSVRHFFFREVLQALLLKRTLGNATIRPPLSEEAAVVNTVVGSPARSQSQHCMAKRQKLDLGRSRRRSSAAWKNVLQSIPETSPLVEFSLPVVRQQHQPEQESKQSSPYRARRSNSAPGWGGIARNISPPRRVHFKVDLQTASSTPNQHSQLHLEANKRHHALYKA